MYIHYKQILSEMQDYVYTLPKQLILWGAGRCGENCFNWLCKMELSKRVIAFIDSDVSKHGHTLFGLPICDSSLLDGEQNAGVVICTMMHHSVYGILQQIDWNGKLFFFEDRLPLYYNNERGHIDLKELSALYSDDYTTQALMNISMNIRSQEFGAVIPYMYAKSIPSFEEYWDMEDTALDMFEGITIVDLGAFIGDSIELWHKKYNKRIRKIYAVEPNADNFERLKHTIESLDLQSRTQLFQCATGSTKGTITMSASVDQSHVVSLPNDGIRTDMVTLDGLDIHPQGKLCIKMDIEGAEMDTLLGGEELIRKYKPELAICVYHKYNDIVEIPKYLKSIVPEYNMILRGGAHMECYASIHRYFDS